VRRDIFQLLDRFCGPSARFIGAAPRRPVMARGPSSKTFLMARPERASFGRLTPRWIAPRGRSPRAPGFDPVARLLQVGWSYFSKMDEVRQPPNGRLAFVCEALESSQQTVSSARMRDTFMPASPRAAAYTSHPEKSRESRSCGRGVAARAAVVVGGPTTATRESGHKGMPSFLGGSFLASMLSPSRRICGLAFGPIDMPHLVGQDPARGSRASQRGNRSRDGASRASDLAGRSSRRHVGRTDSCP